MSTFSDNNNYWAGRSLSTIIILMMIFAVTSIGLVGIEHTAIWLIANTWPVIFNGLLPAAAISLAISVIMLPNLVHGLLALIGVFLLTVILFLGAGAEYLAFVFTIVYVGAVSILFLFVVMLINIKKTVNPYRNLSFTRKVSLSLILGGTFLLVERFSLFIDNFVTTADYMNAATDTTSVAAISSFISTRFLDVLIFSNTLYTGSSYMFFLISLLLLTAMLGAIILATSTTEVNK